MSAINDTMFQCAVFFLTGILGQEEDVHVWASISFCLVYVISILGNSVILVIIRTDPSLHQPMYIFLSMLAITDLGISISTMLTTLGIFLFNLREINCNACFVQLFFIHSLSFTESSVLLCMAFDRCVAICNPLRYTAILTRPRIVRMGLVSLLRGLSVSFLFPILLKHHQYCRDNILYHSYCLHQDVMTIVCSDISVNMIYVFFATFSSVWLDLLLILLSYVMIVKTVLILTSPAERLKALNTCVSHMCVVLLSYLPGIILSLINRFVKSSSPLVLNVVGNIYLPIVPLINPMVYSVKTKPIRAKIIRLFVK